MKLDKDLEKKLEARLSSVASEDYVATEKPSQSERFKTQLQKNKATRTKVVLIRNLIATCFLLLICFSCLIPIWMNEDNTPPKVVRYYGDNNTVKIQVTEEYLQNYINSNIPNYNFLFEEYEINYNLGTFDEETRENLLAISFTATKIGTPISLEITIVVNKNYTYSEHSNHITGATMQELENKRVYLREIEDSINPKTLILIDRPSYNTYIISNINDSGTINQFTQN